jgi:peptide/nickel transport system permease protein
MSWRPALSFVLRRLAALVVLLAIVSFAIFALLHLAPGSPERNLIGFRPVTEETLQAIRAEHNLDDPFLVQYAKWLGGAVQLDFGSSIRTGETVLSGIRDRLGLTLWLGLYASVIAIGLGVPLGIIAALKRRGPVDRGVVALSVIGVSAPAFTTGLLLLYVFAVVLGWFPSFGEGEGFVDRLYHLTLPALTLAIAVMALVVKLTRAGMIGSLEQDYIAFAQARGVPARRVLGGYAFRNALVPVVTAGGLVLGNLLAGAVLVEVTFALNGVGSLFVESVEAKDIPMVQGLAVLTAIIVVVINLITDLVYVMIDPRIRFGKVAA